MESHMKTKRNFDILGMINKAYDSASAAVLKSIDMLRHYKAGLRTVGETVLDQKQCELQKQELVRNKISFIKKIILFSPRDITEEKCLPRF